MLAVALVAALVSMVVVPPDSEYLGYFDWKTIGCLFCVLAVANAFRRIGAFDRIARMAIEHNKRPRVLLFAILSVTALLSMGFTNDVALIMMLPLSATLLIRLGQVRLVPITFALQALAANLCGMITPFGSPQNIYLYSYYQLGLGEFLATMLLPFAFSIIGIALVALIATRGSRLAKGAPSACSQSSAENPVSRMPIDRRRLYAYTALFVVALLAVFGAIPYLIAVAVIAICVFVADRKALTEVDYALLGTFLCFFVFAGNVSRIPELGNFLGSLMSEWGLLTSALTSQVISNVPAAVILSHFTVDWQPLLVGVNIGGAGTFIGSLASLIAIRYFGLSRKVFPQLRESSAPTTGHFLLVFGLLNMVFLVVLLFACLLVFER